MGVIYYLRRDKETKTNLHSDSIKLPQACLAKQDESERARDVRDPTLTLIHRYTNSLEEPQTCQNVGSNLLNGFRNGLGESTTGVCPNNITFYKSIRKAFFSYYNLFIYF